MQNLMKKIKYLLACVFCILTAQIISLCFANIANAETRLENAVFTEDTLWDKSGSPYIIHGLITVVSGANLTIGPGVEVVADKSDPNVYPGITTDGGSLNIQGEHGDRVEINGLWKLLISKGNFAIADADIIDVDNINIMNSTGTIATSSFSGSQSGLGFLNSKVSVWGSRISGMQQAITVRDRNPIYLMMNTLSADSGGDGNVLLTATTSVPLSISNSSIINSSVYALKSFSTNVVDVRNNWWGSAAGPLNDGVSGNSISGLVADEPWLTSEPVFDPEENKPVCCSSILFIPGLEGSRLFRNEKWPMALGTSVNKLWEPNSNNDVKKLYLNSSGLSINSTIYSGGAIDNALGLEDIYGKFLNFLMSLVKNGTVNESKVFGYDWRKPIAEVVAGREQKATTTESLIETVNELAANSRTGKVTIIAHSNGGLVAKYLVKTLSDLGKADLIDKVISVAVPYLGTPQAIAALLHGDGQSFGYGFIMNEAVARQLGVNMTSAYSLLPSATYFSRIIGPTIAFASTTVKGLNNGSYPQNIQSENDQIAFLSDTYNARATSTASDLETPVKGNNLLLAAANILHGILDPFEWPREIIRYAIVGWNNDTVKEVVYGTRCGGLMCAPIITHTDLVTKMGDGTVIAPSAAYNSGTAASADLSELKNQEKTTIDHTSILEASSTQSAIAGMIETPNNEAGNISPSPFPLPSGFAWGEPDYSKDRGRTGIVVSTHSPVELHAYDEEGNHTGVIPPTPELIAETLADGDSLDDMVTLYENKIPGAHFDLNYTENSSDAETTIQLPDDGKKYRLEIKGIGIGTFEYDVDRYNDNVAIGHAEYDNVPVTPLTLASTSVQYSSIDQTATSVIKNFASTTRPLLVDFDGDGSIDTVATSSTAATTFNSSLYVQSMKKTLITLLGTQSAKAKAFLKRFDRLEDLISKGKDKKVRDLSARLEKRIGHVRAKVLSDKDKQSIIDMIDTFLAQYE